MHQQGQITKVTQLKDRNDGSQVKLVATAYFGAGLHRSIGVDVFKRANSESNWTLCSDAPHPDWKNMSRDEYIKHGRSEKFQTVSHGEIFSVANIIGKHPNEVSANVVFL